MNSSETKKLKSVPVHYVSSTDSTEFTQLCHALKHSTIIGLDAEWKPVRTKPFTFPTVSLLQLACRVNKITDSDSVKELEKKSGVEVEVANQSDSLVFLVDLLEIDIPSIWKVLKEMFVSAEILKLGFKFKQDLTFLSSTFSSHGCEPGFEWMEPYIEIASVYHNLQNKQSVEKLSKNNKSLAAICEELLGISLSKELQCSDWSCRPLTEEQKEYAAADAECLVEIFDIFQEKFLNEGILCPSNNELHFSNAVLGLKEILEYCDDCDNVLTQKYFQASDLIRFATVSQSSNTAVGPLPDPLCISKIPLAVSLSKLVRVYGEKLSLKESDKKPKASKKKGNTQPSVGLVSKGKHVKRCVEYQGPPPWDLSLGGDGCPKFLCDVMVEGLAKYLRSVGCDAAVPYSKKPDARQIIDQVNKEKRILLTRDAKILKHQYLMNNQAYRVESFYKNEQLLEVIQKFKLKIRTDQLMSRCTKCNGRFIQKPLTTEEAIEAAKGFQKIPDCLFDHNIEFWQCMDCKQLYWEGTQYHNAVEKFIGICKLNKWQPKTSQKLPTI
ncbi:hypothetical protein AQUCO_03700191v1 [Aquilegia coerulea]|uniref:3'-5' exonuclease domain-containing protein n=1 Tax=Aquilegia coerulea TaxID=218851 RepID=A0A2G5CTZ7_AQUCA|nr:hypothetical protein AQUCO_03700191v1 [Aquilegia coerulea]PIA34753.1 hypothetical protein AQUCO_03700191v1 [Aquilegia coerulea]PIA34754.1 hypothetical protein AQUCO_03700191v1 [Aquilegia coerulea]